MTLSLWSKRAGQNSPKRTQAGEPVAMKKTIAAVLLMLSSPAMAAGSSVRHFAKM